MLTRAQLDRPPATEHGQDKEEKTAGYLYVEEHVTTTVSFDYATLYLLKLVPDRYQVFGRYPEGS